MILGVAFQAGKLPFTLEDLKNAILKSVPKAEYENNLIAFDMGRRVFIEGDKELLDKYKVRQKKTREELLYQSLSESMPPWLNKKVMLNIFNQHLERLIKYFPEIKRSYLIQYLHDLYIYDRGARATEFIQKAGELGEYFKEDNDLRAMALRTLAKTYFVKDEVFVSHIMISPQKREADRGRFQDIGTGFKLKRINRPAFEVFGKKIEFDVSPKDWMLKIMRHMRVLRILLRSWHSRERKISKEIRRELFEVVVNLPLENQRTALKKLENIKGYREYRYDKAIRLENEV
jgi:indolepyruvate ferredoxin oxidoreductase